MVKNDNLERSVRNYNAHFARANLFVELANRTEQGLSSTLFLIATIFLGLTSPLVSDIQGLSAGLKTTLFISWILTVVSILAGLEQIRTNLRFFEWHFKLSNSQEGIWAEMPSDDTAFNKTAKDSDEKAAQSPMQTTFTPLITQATTMVLAIVLVMIVGGMTLIQGKSQSSQTGNCGYTLNQNDEKMYRSPNWHSRNYDKIQRCNRLR